MFSENIEDLFIRQKSVSQKFQVTPPKSSKYVFQCSAAPTLRSPRQQKENNKKTESPSSETTHRSEHQYWSISDVALKSEKLRPNSDHIQTKFRPKSRPNSDPNSDKIQTKFRPPKSYEIGVFAKFRPNSDQNSDQIQTKIETNFRPSSNQNSDQYSDHDQIVANVQNLLTSANEKPKGKRALANMSRHNPSRAVKAS